MTTVDKHRFIAEGKLLKLLQLMAILCKNKYRVEELASIIDVSKRSIQRYLNLLEFMEVPIEKDFHERYFIVEGQCPLCGNTTNNPLL
jgi:predicted DNA-binding transcriptional regulator YafY